MLLLSPGNVNDIAFAPALIAAAGPIKRLIADKAYDANSLRQLLADQCAKAVIPSTMSRRQPIPYSKTIYRQRNLIERMFARLKDFRRIATRYDKLARTTFLRWDNLGQKKIMISGAVLGGGAPFGIKLRTHM